MRLGWSPTYEEIEYEWSSRHDTNQQSEGGSEMVDVEMDAVSKK